MEVLFVCRANIGRSQTAAEFYNELEGAGTSAGTKVDAPGEQLHQQPVAKTIIEVMLREYGIDMSANTRKQVSPEMLDGYKAVVVMAEPEHTPEWLAEHPQARIWEVEDPKDKSEEKTAEIVALIRGKVLDLASELDS